MCCRASAEEDNKSVKDEGVKGEKKDKKHNNDMEEWQSKKKAKRHKVVIDFDDL